MAQAPSSPSQADPNQATELQYRNACFVDLPAAHETSIRPDYGFLSTIQEDSAEGPTPRLCLSRTQSSPIVLSTQRLQKLDPDVSGLKGLRDSMLARLCCFLPPSHRLQEHLIFGQCNPATVVSVSPLIVAAYAGPLDCAVLLRFRQRAVGQNSGLLVGSHLLAVNTYKRAQGPLDPDLEPGPKARVNIDDFPCTMAGSVNAEFGNPLYETQSTLGQAGSGQLLYSGVYPLIADFLSEEQWLVDRRKEQFVDSDWRYILRLGLTKLQQNPGHIRDGRPSMADQAPPSCRTPRHNPSVRPLEPL